MISYTDAGCLCKLFWRDLFRSYDTLVICFSYCSASWNVGSRFKDQIIMLEICDKEVGCFIGIVIFWLSGYIFEEYEYKIYLPDEYVNGNIVKLKEFHEFWDLWVSIFSKFQCNFGKCCRFFFVKVEWSWEYQVQNLKSYKGSSPPNMEMHEFKGCE